MPELTPARSWEPAPDSATESVAADGARQTTVVTKEVTASCPYAKAPLMSVGCL